MSLASRTLFASLLIVPLGCGIDGEAPAPVETQAAATSCTKPTAGMTITKNVTLCAGTFTMNTAAGAAAINVGASNITVTCSGTIIQGPGPVGPDVSPNVGFSIVGRSGVKLLGCAAKKFQYGAVVKNSSSITLDSTHFDDNYNDPTIDWVQDGVQGGGVRLENVTASVVKNSTFERNWNGIELRGGSGNTVNNDVADHCSNWGALVVASNNNTITNSDFSWAIRGGGLAYPNSWYGGDTKDSAGIVIDGGSTGNLIQGNNTRYGGDGIFIRTILGPCATGNRVIGNDASFSPNNGIESWCDSNIFSGNTANSCNYGLWLGGSDSATVTGNTADSNVIDGISTQSGEDRHSIIQDNVLTNNGRAGLFLAGASYGGAMPPAPENGNRWNSSQILVQRNRFSGNSSYDVYLAWSRSVMMASNSLTASKVVAEGGGSTAVVQTIGNFTSAAGRTPPTAALASPGAVRGGVPVTFDASGSRLSASGGTLAYTWLIQAGGIKFAAGLPPLVFGGTGTSRNTVTFSAPGFYDVDVTVTDGFMGSLASLSIPVAPGGVRVGETPASWFAQCIDPTDCAGTTFTSDAAGVEGEAVHMVTNAGFNVAMVTPPAKNLALNASGYTKFGFFVKANNPHTWQDDPPNPHLPVIVLGSPTGTLTYEPATTILPNLSDGWTFIEVPLAPAAGSGWTLTSAGGSLSQVNWVEIHADTWDSGFDLWVDAVSFY